MLGSDEDSDTVGMLDDISELLRRRNQTQGNHNAGRRHGPDEDPDGLQAIGQKHSNVSPRRYAFGIELTGKLSGTAMQISECELTTGFRRQNEHTVRVFDRAELQQRANS